MLLRDRRAILGIDPTHDGVAFAFFEEGAIVDWGTSRKDGSEPRILDRLLDDYGAEVVVIEDGDAPKSERRARMRKLLRELAMHARARGLAVVTVRRRDVHDAWEKRGITRKYAVAAALADCFPDLAPIVPPPRKIYRREVPRERIFGTVALVVHTFGTVDAREMQVPPNGTSLASAAV